MIYAYFMMVALLAIVFTPAYWIFAKAYCDKNPREKVEDWCAIGTVFFLIYCLFWIVTVPVTALYFLYRAIARRLTIVQ